MDKDYVVPPLEGLWWAEDMSDFITRRKDRWLWTMMIMQPEWITRAHVDEARERAAKKKLTELKSLINDKNTKG